MMSKGAMFPKGGRALAWPNFVLPLQKLFLLGFLWVGHMS